MNKTYLNKIRVAAPVEFNGPADISLLARHGTLIWDVSGGFVECRPDNKPGRLLVLPIGNISFMETMPESQVTGYLLGREPKPVAPKTAPVPTPKPPAKSDTIVFVKDPETGKILEKRQSEIDAG